MIRNWLFFYIFQGSSPSLQSQAHKISTSGLHSFPFLMILLHRSVQTVDELKQVPVPDCHIR
jgi:hypothetical protein